jgi:hypothetical protein
MARAAGFIPPRRDGTPPRRHVALLEHFQWRA